MSNNRIRVVGTFKDNISREVSRVRDSFDRLGNSKGAKTLLQGVGLGAGVSAWNLVGSAVSGAIDMMGQAVDAASNLRESMALSQQVFEGNAGAVQEWGESAADAFGMSSREALNFASSFGTAFKNVGMSLDDTTAKAEEMTRLAADIGSAFNASSEEAATALRAGLLGESEPLRRFGVFLNEAAVGAKAVEMGIARAGEKLSDGQKVAARYALIMEQTADSQGMFGRDTESLADAQKSLSAEFENMQAQMGTALLPTLVKLADVLKDDVLPAFEGFLDLIGTELPGGISVLDALLSGLAMGFGQVGFAANSLSDKMKDRALQEAAIPIQNMSNALAEANAGWSTMAYRSAVAVDPIDDAAKALGHVEIKGFAAADALDAMKKAWGELDDELEQKRRLEDMPDLIRVAADEAKTAYADLRKAIKSGDDVAIAAARLRYREARREVADLRTEWRRLRREMEQKITIGRITQASQLDAIQPGRAAGGPVQAGQAYVVGEAGRELFVPKMDGRIVSNNELVNMGGSAVAMGSTPVNLAVYLDSEQIAAKVERRQYFAASVAPASIR